MITQELFNDIKTKYGHFASWAVWASEGENPKSNVGDMSVFDLSVNPDLLEQLNPNIIMVGLNFSRTVDNVDFANFHDKRSQAQDYKIRYAFKDTEFYGAYMTDIIKDFEEKISGKVLSYLESNKDFEIQNVKYFEKEITDLKCKDPLIIAFGEVSFQILKKHFDNKYKIKKVIHYSNYISKEKYREQVLQCLRNDQP